MTATSPAPQNATAVAPTAYNVSFDQLKAGDKLSELQYYTVDSIDRDKNKAVLVNQRGLAITTAASVIESSMYSASQVQRTETVSLTEAAGIIENAGHEAFSASFNKKADSTSIGAAVQAYLQQTDATSATFNAKELAKFVKEAGQGAERVITARLLSTEAKLGRSTVLDLAINQPRLVDHRTLNWVVFRGVKYLVRS